uniref:Methyltransferase n=1 Tax=Phenylobacterium glaciei TaxID=2803784 RepID=A0A974P521_9CAUL|nr:methyltransferase [Phenylobacterium glaciei]
MFFGPDSYRFADFIRAELGHANRVVDIGAGAGVGGIVAARACPQAAIVLADINPQALRLARINAAAAVVSAEVIESDGLSKVTGAIDVAIANPPYLLGSGGRAYRDGGDLLGARLSLDWAKAAMARLPAGAACCSTPAAPSSRAATGSSPSWRPWPQAPAPDCAIARSTPTCSAACCCIRPIAGPTASPRWALCWRRPGTLKQLERIARRVHSEVARSPSRF